MKLTTTLAVFWEASDPKTSKSLCPDCPPARSDSPRITITGIPFDMLVCQKKNKKKSTF